MKRAKTILPIFFVFIALSLIILFFIQNPLIQPLQAITVPIQKWVYTTYTRVPIFNQNNESQLQQENNNLRKELAKSQAIERENKTLRNQLKKTTPVPRDLLPATVMGMSEGKLFIDKGEREEVSLGDIIIVGDNLIGKVTKVSPHVSVVTLITHADTSFTAETSKTAAIGVIKSPNGDGMLLGNVVLSDRLENNDIIVTKGDVDEKGGGFPPKLVVGKIISVNKQASSLFQLAQVRSFVDFNRVQTVFVIVD